MRELKQVRNFVGLAMLTAFVPQAQTQEARQVIRPTQKLEAAPIRVSVPPAQFEWNELVQIQASLPRLGLPVDQAPFIGEQGTNEMGEAKDIVVPMPGVQPVRNHAGNYLRPETSAPQGDIERLISCTGFPVIPAASLSTIGQPDGPDSFATLFPRPNAAGSVGPNHLMVMAPNITLIQNRLGATISSVDTITFWSPLAPASVTYCRLDYDQVSDRWIATARGGAGVGACSILFAISDTDDPTGGWDYYSVPADPGLTTFPDGLKMGYNQNWVVVTADMYSSTVAGGNQGSRLYTFDMAAALAGGPVTANTFPSSYVFTLTGQGNALVNWRNIPTRSLDGSLADIHLLNSRLATAANILFQMVRITGTGPAPTLAVTPNSLFAPTATASLMFIPFDYTNSRQAVFQVGDVRNIDPLQTDGTFASTRARLADAVVRNGKLWIVQNSGLPGPAAAVATQNGLGFYELDPAGPLADPFTSVGPFNQQVQITDGINTTCFYPSISVNCAEDVLIGFSRSDATKNLEAAYCMRLGSDPVDTMGPTTLLKAGESSWWQLGPPPATTLGAWGYYSSTSIDPNDDTTMWTLQPYAATRVGAADADSRWGNWWGRLGDCEILPVITSDPVGISGCVGDPASFSVVATTGSNPLSYQWRLNGADILGANSDTYSIVSTVAADEGVYDVVVSGCGSVISQTATLEFGEPTITTQPTDYIAALGDPAAFFVVATPILGSLNYQWFHGNTPVGNNDDIFILGATVASDYYPSNEYHCVVSDDCGPIASSTVKLMYPPKGNFAQPEFSLHIFKNPTSVFGCTGESATFSVVAFPPTVSYEWRKDGTPIVPPETGSSLTLNGLSAADVGSYDCVVSLGSASRTSAAAGLTVNDGPTVTVHPSPASQNVDPGDFVSYSVTATGTGTLTYQWQKKPQVPFATYDDIPGAVGDSLTIGPINSSDAGQYRCVVRNACGLDRSAGARIVVN
jgi:Ig-like domain-containing protein